MYQPGEDPQRTVYRVMFWLGIMLNTVLFLWSVAASYFDFQSSWTPYPLAALGFLTIMNIGFYGDFAMNRALKADTYRFLVLQYFLSGTTLIVSSFAFIQIDQVSPPAPACCLRPPRGCPRPCVAPAAAPVGGALPRPSSFPAPWARLLKQRSPRSETPPRAAIRRPSAVPLKHASVDSPPPPVPRHFRREPRTSRTTGQLCRSK